MKTLDNMNVGSKIILLVAILLLLMSIIAGVGIFMLRDLDKQANTMYGNNVLALSHIKEANIQLLGMSRAIRNMALMPLERRPVYQESYNKYLATLRKEMAATQALLLTQVGKTPIKKQPTLWMPCTPPTWTLSARWAPEARQKLLPS